MAFTVRFVKAPLLSDQSTALCEQFVGLEVPLCRLEVVGILEAHIDTQDSHLAMSDGRQLDPNYVVVEMAELILAAKRNNRLLLVEYLAISRIKKLLVPRSLVTVL